MTFAASNGIEGIDKKLNHAVKRCTVYCKCVDGKLGTFIGTFIITLKVKLKINRSSDPLVKIRIVNVPYLERKYELTMLRENPVKVPVITRRIPAPHTKFVCRNKIM